MRLLGVSLLLLSAPLLAQEERLAARLPQGAVALVEVRGLAGRVDDFLASPLGRAIVDHPAMKQFLASPQARGLAVAELMLAGSTGYDARGLLRALAAKEVAIALYPGPEGGKPRALLAARVEPEAAGKILGGAELITKQPRTEILPAADGAPALWSFASGKAFALLDGDLLLVAGDEATARSVRARPEASLAGDERVAAARRLFDGEPLAFAFVDLALLPGALRGEGKAKDLGEALILGALRSYVPRAPWAAFALDLDPLEAEWRFTLRGRVPVPGEGAKPAEESFGGTLAPLPFALPERTLGVVRLKRNISALWSHRDELIAERGIPQLLEFETNFGNLMGGMSFVDEFLPNIGSELVFLATRAERAEGRPAPEVRLPQFALLYPLQNAEKLGTNLQVAFQSAIGVFNVLSAQEGGKPLLLGSEQRNGVLIQTATHLPPSEGESEGMRGLPIRYNFAPACAVVGGWFVLGSTGGIVREVVDSWGGPAAPPTGVNAGLWLRGAESLRALEENRGPLVARNMIEKGHDREAAEREIDLLLDLARRVREIHLTVEEERGALGITFRFVAGK